MTNSTIIDMLNYYKKEFPKADNKIALTILLQELILIALNGANFFKYAVCNGGVALRTKYTKAIFTEALNFSLLNPNPHFISRSYLKAIILTIRSYGFKIKIHIYSETNSKNILEYFININLPKGIPYEVYKESSIQLSIKIDKDPAPDFKTEPLRLNIPRSSIIIQFSCDSLFAMNIHKILSRNGKKHINGRDLADFIFFDEIEVKLNLKYLKARLTKDYDYLKENNIDLNNEFTKEFIIDLLIKRIESSNIDKARKDVMKFLKLNDYVKYWHKEFFIKFIKRIQVI